MLILFIEDTPVTMLWIPPKIAVIIQETQMIELNKSQSVQYKNSVLKIRFAL